MELIERGGDMERHPILTHSYKFPIATTTFPWPPTSPGLPKSAFHESREGRGVGGGEFDNHVHSPTSVEVMRDGRRSPRRSQIALTSQFILYFVLLMTGPSLPCLIRCSRRLMVESRASIGKSSRLFDVPFK
jgi:hypothetical protein